MRGLLRSGTDESEPLNVGTVEERNYPFSAMTQKDWSDMPAHLEAAFF